MHVHLTAFPSTGKGARRSMIGRCGGEASTAQVRKRQEAWPTHHEGTSRQLEVILPFQRASNSRNHPHCRHPVCPILDSPAECTNRYLEPVPSQSCHPVDMRRQDIAGTTHA